MTATTPTVEAKRAEIAALAERQDEATTLANDARARHEELDAQVGLGRATEAKVADAAQAVVAAEKVETRLASSMALLESELADAQEAEREQRRADLGAEGAAAEKARHAAAKRLSLALARARDALTAYDQAAADGMAVRHGIKELRNVDAEKERIDQKYQDKYDRLLRESPLGMEPNPMTIERDRDAEIAALLAAAEQEAVAVAAPPDAGELDTIAESFRDCLPWLVPPDVRQALAQGHEYVTRPERVSTVYGMGSTSRRIYSEHEWPEANARYDSLLAVMARLGGPPALTLAQEAGRRTVSGGGRA